MQHGRTLCTSLPRSFVDLLTEVACRLRVWYMQHGDDLGYFAERMAAELRSRAAGSRGQGAAGSHTAANPTAFSDLLQATASRNKLPGRQEQGGAAGIGAEAGARAGGGVGTGAGGGGRAGASVEAGAGSGGKSGEGLGSGHGHGTGRGSGAGLGLSHGVGSSKVKAAARHYTPAVWSVGSRALERKLQGLLEVGAGLHTCPCTYWPRSDVSQDQTLPFVMRGANVHT